MTNTFTLPSSISVGEEITIKNNSTEPLIVKQAESHIIHEREMTNKVKEIVDMIYERISHLRKKIAEFPEHKSLNMQADVSYMEGRFEEACTLISEIINRCPLDVPKGMKSNDK